MSMAAIACRQKPLFSPAKVSLRARWPLLPPHAHMYVHTCLQMLARLSDFEGTCLTLLVRGLAPPPVDIEEAFSRLPSERFGVTHLPPYSPSFGFVADRLMLSWAVRTAGATAFVSTLYTHPYVVRKLTAMG